jgi:hypothetical protein
VEHKNGHCSTANKEQHTRQKKNMLRYLFMHIGLPTRFPGSGGAAAAASNNNNIHIKLKAAAQTNCLLKYNALALLSHIYKRRGAHE